MDIDLSGYVTLAEAAATLKKSQKQVVRYINQKMLPGTQKIGLRYFIPKAAVAALAAKPVQIEDSVSGRLRRLEERVSSHLNQHQDNPSQEIERRFDEMAGQILALQSEIATLKAQIQREPAQLSDKMAGQIPKQQKGVTGTSQLPPGFVTARRFAEVHGFTRDQMLGWIRRGEVSVTHVTMAGGKTQDQLDRAQQKAVIAFWKASGLEYGGCPQCPHE